MHRQQIENSVTAFEIFVRHAAPTARENSTAECWVTLRRLENVEMLGLRTVVARVFLFLRRFPLFVSAKCATRKSQRQQTTPFDLFAENSVCACTLDRLNSWNQWTFTSHQCANNNEWRRARRTFDVLIEAHIFVYTSVMIAELIIAPLEVSRKQACVVCVCVAGDVPLCPRFFYYYFACRFMLGHLVRIICFFLPFFAISFRNSAPTEWEILLYKRRNCALKQYERQFHTKIVYLCANIALSTCHIIRRVLRECVCLWMSLSHLLQRQLCKASKMTAHRIEKGKPIFVKSPQRMHSFSRARTIRVRMCLRRHMIRLVRCGVGVRSPHCSMMTI